MECSLTTKIYVHFLKGMRVNVPLQPVVLEEMDVFSQLIVDPIEIHHYRCLKRALAQVKTGDVPDVDGHFALGPGVWELLVCDPVLFINRFPV